MLARRIAQFSEQLSLERERLLGWGLVQAVLSAWWSCDSGEDKSGWLPMLGFAEMLAQLNQTHNLQLRSNSTNHLSPIPNP